MRNRVNLGRGPLVLDTFVERYGVEQRKLNPVDDDPTDWHGGWPAYTERKDAEASLAYFQGVSGYVFRIRVYPPDPPACAWRMETA